tara:strand:+ start:14490 stop:15179 length:690 start_codon:yes stop_codon:yes gene_type:complete
MSDYTFQFCGTKAIATAGRALWLPDMHVLCVSDLHLGRSGRIARRAGTMLPPFETDDTLTRLGDEIARWNPQTVICLGDSFDDLDAAQDISTQASATIAHLQAGRRWIWVEGNHDPGPIALGGSHHNNIALGGLRFCHIASDQRAEISGHYHPKHGLRGTGPARPCFLYDAERLIMPAFGTYTGGLLSHAAPLLQVFPTGAIAIMTGRSAIPVPVTEIRPTPRSRGRFY